MANEISNANAPSVVDSNGNPVEDATIIAVKQEDVAALSQSQATEIQALAKLTDVNGDFTFSKSELYNDQNQYVVVALEESGEQRGTPNYPHVDATGNTIPDSEANQKLAHRYYLSTLDDGIAEDAIGDENGTNNGVASVQGDWVDGEAGDGDASSYINHGTLGSYGSNMQPGAIVFSFQWQNSDNSHFLGTDVNQNLQIAIGHDIAASGELYLDLKDNNGKRDKLRTDSSSSTLTNGNPHRIVMNFPGTDASNYGFWIDQTEVSTIVDKNQGASMEDFTQNVYSFAKNGGPNATDNIIDDLCLFDDSLTETEIKSYSNPWS